MLNKNRQRAPYKIVSMFLELLRKKQSLCRELCQASVRKSEHMWTCFHLYIQMRQLNKDGQKQVNYVICIPPMCTEKGVRLQHKFIVNKDDEDAGI